MKTTEKVTRGKPIPEVKKELINRLIKGISEHRTVLIASCKGLPGKQFHKIRKELRKKVEIKVAKKSAVNRAIDGIEKGAIKNLKSQVGADIVIMFSDLDPFELSGLLVENQSPARAKPGDIAPENIRIDAGPTELVPGPAISELGNVGLKVSVKDGKLEIMKGATVVKKGEKINENVASVLGKLDITPMEVGFLPLAAYDSKDDKVYVDIIIDKKGTLKTLRDLLGKALGFAIKVSYPTKETIHYLISKAAAEEKALEKLIGKKSEKPAEEEEKEKPSEEKEEFAEEKRGERNSTEKNQGEKNE